MIDIYPSLPIVTLPINGQLKNSLKTGQKAKPNYVLCTKTHFKYENSYIKTKVNGKQYIMQNPNKRKPSWFY